MKTYKQATEIQPGQITELRDQLYIAKKAKPHIPCYEQCKCYNIATERCNGYCYRWRNFMEIVFLELSEPEEDYEIVETQFGKACRDAAEHRKETICESDS